MRRLHPSLVIAFAVPAVLGATAAHAGAQANPPRVRTVVRTAVEVPRVELYQRGTARETRTDRSTKTLRIGATGELTMSNIAGDIVVNRGGGNDVVIEVVKSARAATADEATQALQLVQVDIVERGGRVEVRTRYPEQEELRRRNWRNLNVSVAFNVTAPERARISANSISGHISVKDIKGDLTLDTISGDIQISNAGRISRAKSASGDIEISDTTVDGRMDASTISGDLVLRNVKARQLELGSISGDVLAENVECERVDGQSISGTVRLSGPLVSGGRYTLGSHSGEVHVAFSGDVGFEINASSFSGAVRADVNLQLTGSSAPRRGRLPRSLRGTYGDGGAFLDLTTFSGTVVLTKK